MTQQYITEQDVLNYGTDLLDMTQRAAIQATAPHLNALQRQNAELQHQLAREQRHRLDQQVAEAVPDYQEIDQDPAWHRWLLQIDPLSGEIRQRVLDDAIAAGPASRVRAFFEGFRRENHGSEDHGSRHSRAPRGGRAPSSHGVATYTREQIRKLYEQHRQGAYKEREAEWAQIEADLFAAQREGRVLAYPWVSK